MKMNYVKTRKVLLGVTLALIAISMKAQQGYGIRSGLGYGRDSGIYAHAIPNLTVDQEKKINELRTVHLKEMTNYRNDLAIKQAELQKFKSTDKPDMNLINKTIDETGKLTTEMQKNQVAHQLTVHNLLTDEQKIAFDNRRRNSGSFNGRGMRGTGSRSDGRCVVHGDGHYRM